MSPNGFDLLPSRPNSHSPRELDSLVRWLDIFLLDGWQSRFSDFGTHSHPERQTLSLCLTGTVRIASLARPHKDCNGVHLRASRIRQLQRKRKGYYNAKPTLKYLLPHRSPIPKCWLRKYIKSTEMWRRAMNRSPVNVGTEPRLPSPIPKHRNHSIVMNFVVLYLCLIKLKMHAIAMHYLEPV
jgi:hypothetical protein